MTTTIAACGGSKSKSAISNTVRSKSTRSKSVSPPTATQQRALRLKERVIECISHSSFRHPEYVESLLALQLPPLQNPDDAPGGTSGYLSGLYEVELLSGLQEEQLFALMNLLKFQAQQLQKKLDLSRPSIQTMNTIERQLTRANEVRNHIVRANLRLVVALAKKFAASSGHLEDLISEGHLPLIRAVELFDFSRGFRFSTYATWAVRNHFLRSRKDDARYQERFHDGAPFALDHALDPRNSWQADESQRTAQQVLVDHLLSQLNDREREILSARFGLDGQCAEQTLAEIGDRIGLSKERVRQLAARALEKLGTLATPGQTVL